MKKSLTLDPRRTALLLVDFQEEQREPSTVVAGFATVMANAGKLLAAARAKQIRVFHAAYRRDFDLRPPRPFELR
ncbi:MAG: isochorismatase family protein, partial [Rhizobiales bacterium]|nr:isochorismatase family protein [Hyphomicrobiales bacterium]